MEIRDGLAFILGGGWSRFNVSALPFDAVWPVFCVATWTEIDESVVRGLQLCLSNPGGVEVARILLEVPSGAITDGQWRWLTSIGAPLDREGRWRLHVQSGEYLLSQLDVMVKLSGPQVA